MKYSPKLPFTGIRTVISNLMQQIAQICKTTKYIHDKSLLLSMEILMLNLSFQRVHYSTCIGFLAKLWIVSWGISTATLNYAYTISIACDGSNSRKKWAVLSVYEEYE